jgi:hypothetical protein
LVSDIAIYAGFTTSRIKSLRQNVSPIAIGFEMPEILVLIHMLSGSYSRYDCK